MTVPCRRAVWFFVSLLGLCALFMWPWRAVEVFYGRLFVTCGNGLIDAGGGDSGLLSTTGAANLEADYDGPSG